MALEKGQRVTVYFNPLKDLDEGKSPEGVATLLEEVEPRSYQHRNDFALWSVQFDGKDEPVNRIVGENHIVAEKQSKKKSDDK